MRTVAGPPLLESFLIQLDGGPGDWTTLLILADHCEEEGFTREAAGLRELTGMGKKPYHLDPTNTFGWYNPSPEKERYTMPAVDHRLYPEALPVDWWLEVRQRETIAGNMGAYFRTRGEAYWEAAKAYARGQAQEKNP